MNTPAASDPPANAPEAEYRALLRLGLPILATQLAQMAMGVVDTIMAGRYGTLDLAGVALGGAVLWPIIFGMMGILQAVTPTVAQLNGAGRQRDTGQVIPQALWMISLPTIVLVLLMHNIAPFYAWLEVDPMAIPVSVAYLQATSLGVPAVMIYYVLRFLCEGLGESRPAMVIALAALLLKIPLNYWFIHGGLGLPAMGGAGCGVATAIVMWFEMLVMVWVALKPKFRATGWASRLPAPDLVHIRRLLAIGLPIGATVLFEVGVFSLVALLMGRLGADVLAAHSVTVNVAGLTFMFPFALGMAATIRVGFHVGSGNLATALGTAWLAARIAILLALVMGVGVYVGRFALAELYSNDPAVIALAASLLLFVAGYQLADNLQATLLGALRGFKDTLVPMVVTLVGYWLVGLPVALVLGLGLLTPAMGAAGLWWGLVAGLVFVAAFATARLWWLGSDPVRIQQISRRYEGSTLPEMDE